MWRLTPSSARNPPKFLRMPSMSTAIVSAIGNPLLIRPHRAQPALGQQDSCLFAVDVESRHPFRHRSGQQVKEDRTDEPLQRQQRRPPAPPPPPHLTHPLTAPCPN